MSGVLLHLLRHGAPERSGRMLGRTDDLPTQAGIAACVERGSGLAIGGVVTSDLLRSRMAGETLAAVSDSPLTIDPRWRELDFGDWDGLTSAQIDPDALGRFWNDPDACPPPGGERWSTLVARVRAAIEALPPAPTLVVAHGGAMRAALAVLCGLDARQVWAFDLPYASLLSLRLWPGDTINGQLVGLRT